MRHAVLLLALLTATPALADDARTFGGELDGRAIVMELTDGTSGPVVGRFAFRDSGDDIPLLPVSHQGNAYVLYEEAPCDETTCKTDDLGNAIDPPIAAEWRLTYDPQEHVLTGTRTTLGGKGKEIPVAFDSIGWRIMDPSETISAYALHDRSVMMSYDDTIALAWGVSPYEMDLLDVPFEAAPPETLGEATFNYVTDPRTKFAFPRVIEFAGEPDEELVAVANAILADQHGRMNLSAFNCLAFRYASYGKGEYMSEMGGTLGDYDGETVTLTYASPKLLSWMQSGSLWCTGASPYNHVDSYTIDLTTGEPLDLSKVFSAWVPREWGATPAEVADLEAAKSDPDSYHWGPSADLIAFVREHLPDDLFDAELEEICFSDQAIADQLDIRFEAEGRVTFTLSGFPHVISVCNGDVVTVDLAEVEEFLAPTAGDYLAQ